jgi:hypothetical protein
VQQKGSRDYRATDRPQRLQCDRKATEITVQQKGSRDNGVGGRALRRKFAEKRSEQRRQKLRFSNTLQTMAIV